ncbi:MAG TPA: cellulose synthase family protein [Anaerolineales bacterium]|nr:cellulose synthase family protein [Anaerolineales bacterium]
MQIISYLLGALYLLIVFVLAMYGFHNLMNAILYLNSNSASLKKRQIPQIQEYPRVTIQLPIFNEKYTIERLLDAVTKLDYPAECLQIQVLDDSIDNTASLTKKLVEDYRAKGVNIEWIHRTDRKGYKAGALANGLRTATGELLAIFDADFVPKSDWLKKTVPLFKNERLGCLQTRWGHTNRNYNSLTQVEAMAIDGHFIVEQAVRSQNDFFLNFNGTAGLWRRACIEDAGGWQWDTLTEDLDLSYRAQMRGWKIDYLPDVVVPAELPAHVEAFKNQQFRWAKGSFQVVRKILPRLFDDPKLPLHVRLLAILHLTGYGVHPLMLGLLILTLPVGLFAPASFRLFPLSILAGFGPPLVYLAAKAAHTPPLWERLKLLPLLTITGFGLCLNTSVAVIEGLFGKGKSVFVRTPKLNLNDARKHLKSVDKTYIVPLNPLVWVEFALGIYALISGIVLEPIIGWGIVPWMIIYMLGFFYMGGMSLMQNRQTARKKLPELTPEKSV